MPSPGLPSGLKAVAALAGLTDVDAITLSMSEDAQVAVIAIVIAAATSRIPWCASSTDAQAKCGPPNPARPPRGDPRGREAGERLAGQRGNHHEAEQRGDGQRHEPERVAEIMPRADAASGKPRPDA